MNDYLQDKRTKPIFIHSSIDDMTALTPNDMRVYMHIARRADNDAGAAWPSYQSIGDHCFASVSDNAATRKSFARKAIDNLIAIGLIEKHNRYAEDGGQQSNVYVLVDPPCLISTPRAESARPVLNQHQRYSNEGTPMKVNDGLTSAITAQLQTHMPFGVTPQLVEQHRAIATQYGLDAWKAGFEATPQRAKHNANYVLKATLSNLPEVEPVKKATPATITIYGDDGRVLEVVET